MNVISQLTNYESGYLKTKCAEIHYESKEFSIYCIFCGATTTSYEDYTNHFEGEHLMVFKKRLEKSSETEHRKPNDPLEYIEKECEKSAEVALQELQDEEEVKVDDGEVAIAYTLAEQAFVQDTEDIGLSEEEKNFVFESEQVEEAALASSVNTENEHESDVEFSEEDEAEAIHDDSKQIERLEKMPLSSQLIHMLNNVTVEKEKVPAVVVKRPKPPTYRKKRTPKEHNEPIVCKYCDRTFRRRFQLETHLNIHTGTKPHQCDVCGRLFRAITTLMRHLNTHEKREMHNCKYCGKTFKHRAALISHEMRHTQMRRVPCDECEKCFYTENQMDTHKRKVHHKTDDETLPFACELCTKRYRSASMLSTHKLRKHYRTAKIACEQCDKKFISEQHLKKHESIHTICPNEF